MSLIVNLKCLLKRSEAYIKYKVTKCCIITSTDVIDTIVSQSITN